MDKTAKNYRNFFKDSPAGQHFMEQLDRLIESSHQKAEDEPESARDHMQRAKGKREVVGLINSLMTEAKKPMR